MYLRVLIAWLPAGILLYAFVCGNGSMFVKRSHPFGVRCEALEISFPSLYGSDANSRFRIARNVVHEYEDGTWRSGLLALGSVVDRCFNTSIVVFRRRHEA